MREQQSPFTDRLAPRLDTAKFQDPQLTATGERRAAVAFDRLDTLWINTGTLCNLSCTSCYIESSPTNDALIYVTLREVEKYLDQARLLGTREIGFTGGEPFMNRDIVAMIKAALDRGFEVLVLTNAMRPMRRFEAVLKPLASRNLTLRVSLDHYSKRFHEEERGAGTWGKVVDGLCWLSDHGFKLAIAGRQLPGESEESAREGFRRLFHALGINVSAGVVVFPTMDETTDVPEISETCWDKLGVSPSSPMCATSRMIVKSKGDEHPHVVACTLLPYDPQFALGESLIEAKGLVPLNHPHCARFCVLGGANCLG